MINLKKYGNKIAIVEDNQKITYSQLECQINNIYKKISNFNNSIIALWMDNSINYIIGYFSSIKGNNTVLPIYSKTSKNEIYGELDEFKTSLLITTREKWMLLEPHKVNCSVFLIDETIFILDNVEAETNESISEVYLLLNTSGTTGKSKKVMHSKKNIIHNAQFNIENLSITEKDVCLVCLPLNFGYANTSQLITHLLVGGTLILMKGKFSPKNFINYINEYNVTMTTLVPSQLFMLSNLKNVYSASSLRTICFGAGFTSGLLLQKMKIIFPNVDFVHTYGFTEAGPRITSYLITDENIKNDYFPVGKPISDSIEVKIDFTNNNEVLIRTPTIMRGYFPNKELYTGWYRSGDIGFIDEHGNLVINGRLKNILKIKGYTIYPEEIEKFVQNLDGVDVCRVFEDEDKFVGSVIKLEYVGIAEPSFIKNECRKNLSDYKVPQECIQKEYIEKTYNGKIKRIQEKKHETI